MKKNNDFSEATKNPFVKRIIVSITIENARDLSKSLKCDAIVDPDVSLIVLPASWKDRFGKLESTRIMESKTAGGQMSTFEVCGPVRVELDGFRPIFTEVSFAELKTEADDCKPLVGNIVLEQSQAAVDILGHRLVRIKHMDLKYVHSTRLTNRLPVTQTTSLPAAAK